MFEINWWILVSQTINFIVLFVILKKFLFGPINQVIEDRQNAIAKAKTETDSNNDEAKRLKEECESRLNNIQGEVEALRQKKIAEAQSQIKGMLSDAKVKADSFMEEAELEIFMKRQNMWNQMHSGIAQLATSAAEKIIEQSLDDEMHRKVIASTIDRLGKDLADFKTGNSNSKQLSEEYAESFFTEIDEKGFNRQYDDFKAFAKIYNENDEVRNFLESPAIDVEKKLDLVKKAFANEIASEVLAFINKLIVEKRIQMLNKIVEDFSKLYHNRKSIKAVRVRTKVALTSSEKELLTEVVTKKFGPVDIKEVIDSHVIGGLIIQFENQVVDDSIDARISQLRAMMTKAQNALMQNSAEGSSLTIF